jgi:pSer/pThr/pTyr-binding forkhead associated (FHA) protein
MSESFCSQCGHHNVEGSNFCSACGKSLLEVGEDLTLTLHDPGIGDGTGDVHVAVNPFGPAVLVVNRGPDSGQAFVLEKSVTTAGRNPDADIFLDDVTVSRRHASITHSERGYWITDGGSLNGTYVNTKRVSEIALNPGDEVQIGKFHLVFLSAHREPQHGQQGQQSESPGRSEKASAPDQGSTT